MLPVMKMRRTLLVILKSSLLIYLVILVVLTLNIFDNKERLDNISKSENNVTVKEVEESCVKEVTRIVTQEVLRFGPGEYGKSVNLGKANLSIPELLEKDEKHRFTTFVSDMVGLRRRIPDKRPEACKKIVYPDDLPPAAVVIIFRDELASIVLRTVYSVLQMSPEKILKEIVLVDDGSEDKVLRLAISIHANALEKVRVVRHEVPRGLMMARQSGVEAVTADYFIILDGHMEVTPGWLEPLIYRLVQEPKAMLCSHVGAVDGQTFEFRIGGDIYVFPFFDPLNLNQMFAEYSKEFLQQRNHSVAPIPAGTVQGMMIVMKTQFFHDLGGFDPGMMIWGSEQMELSIKVWMCGGRVEMVPCSIVGHMYRITPWGGPDKNNPDNDFHSINKARTVHVWFDPPYSDFIDDQLSDKNFTEGDLTDRKALRVKNQCKPYQHFVDSVKTFSDVYLPQGARIKGPVSNPHVDRCLDVATNQTDKSKSLILYPCHKTVAANQYFIYTENKQIRSVDAVIIRAQGINSDKIGTLAQIQDRPSPDNTWLYQDKMLKNIMTKKCLTADGSENLVLMNCTNSPKQIWDWKNIVTKRNA